MVEEKKSGQKTSEPILLKKPVEAIKKSKREKRDGSTDSNDSESEGEYKSKEISLGLLWCFLYIR